MKTELQYFSLYLVYVVLFCFLKVVPVQWNRRKAAHTITRSKPHNCTESTMATEQQKDKSAKRPLPIISISFDEWWEGASEATAALMHMHCSMVNGARVLSAKQALFILSISKLFQSAHNQKQGGSKDAKSKNRFQINLN